MSFKVFALAFIVSIFAAHSEARPFSCSTDGVSTEELQRRQEKLIDSNKHGEGFLRYSIGNKKFNRLQNGEDVRMGPMERAVWNGIQVRQECINDIYKVVDNRTQGPLAPVAAQENQQIPGVSVQQPATETASTATRASNSPLVTIEIPQQAAQAATNAVSSTIQRQTANFISSSIAGAASR